MTDNLSLREHLVEDGEQVGEPVVLSLGECVARLALLIQTALVADADGTAVVGTGMSTHLEQIAVLALGAVTADIEVITHLAKAACLMVTLEHRLGIVLVAPRSRAVKDKVKDTLGRAHHCAVFHLGEERALVAHRLPTD